MEEKNTEQIIEDANRKTTMNDDHWHLAEVNQHGTGNTTATFPVDAEQHFHKILGNVISETNGHSHKVLSLINAPPEEEKEEEEESPDESEEDTEEVGESIKEQVELRETNHFKEKIFTLNTGRDKKAFTSFKIKGELKSLILDTDKVISVLIRFKDFPEIVIFNATNFSGQKYFNIRRFAVGSNPTDVFEEGNETWMLNDDIEFITFGNMSTTTKFVVRFK